MHDLEGPWAAICRQNPTSASTLLQQAKMRVLEPIVQIWIKIDPCNLRQKCRPMILVSGYIRFLGIFAGVPLIGGVKWEWGGRLGLGLGLGLGRLGSESPLPQTSPPRRLRRLDLGAFGTSFVDPPGKIQQIQHWAWPRLANRTKIINFSERDLINNNSSFCWLTLSATDLQCHVFNFEQESSAVAKITARCAQSICDLKKCRIHWLRIWLLFLKFLMGFCSHRPCQCICRIWSPWLYPFLR